MKAKGWKN